MSLGGSKLVQPQRFWEIVRITSAGAVQTVAHLHLSFIEALVCSLLPQSKSSVANVAILLRKNLAESKLTVTTVTLRALERQLKRQFVLFRVITYFNNTSNLVAFNLMMHAEGLYPLAVFAAHLHTLLHQL
jgi:hypothetical protein